MSAVRFFHVGRTSINKKTWSHGKADGIFLQCSRQQFDNTLANSVKSSLGHRQLLTCLSVCHSSVHFSVHCWSECYCRLTSLSQLLNTTEENLKKSCYWTSASTVWHCVCLHLIKPLSYMHKPSYCLLSHPPHPFFLSAQHVHTFIHCTVLMCKYECVSACFKRYACVQAAARQCFILGLNQASAPEDCRLMWPISSDYSCMVTVSLMHRCIHTHSGTKRNHSKKKPQDVVYTFVYFSTKECCVFFNSPVCHIHFLQSFCFFLCFFYFSTLLLLIFLSPISHHNLY